MIDFNGLLENIRMNLGLDLPIKDLQPYDNPNLPRYLGRIYQLRSGTLLNIDVLFAVNMEKKVGSITDLSRQQELLTKLSGRQVVYVFECLNRDTTARLVDRRLAFIENKKQVFLPFLLLKLTAEDHRSHSIKKLESLDKWSTVVVIRQLLKGDQAGLNGLQLAKTLGVSAISASRIMADLAAIEICQIQSSGTAKVMKFEDRQSLWKKALPQLKNPVTHLVNLMNKPDSLILDAGESALAQQTSLVQPDQQTFAIYLNRPQISELKKRSVAGPTLYRLEIWDRDPRLTADDTNRIDPISLYLTMRNNPDERIQIALQDLLKTVHLRADE